MIREKKQDARLPFAVIAVIIIFFLLPSQTSLTFS